MVLFGYGDYDWACANVGSLSACNLFFRQILTTQPPSSLPNLLNLPDPLSNLTQFTQALASAPVGIKPTCAIPRSGYGGPGNVALIVVASLSIFAALGLAFRSGKRQAAVGRSEMRIVFILYALCCLFQLLDSGSFLEQGRRPIVWLTGIHTGFVVSLFWTILWIAFLSLQLVEDGNLSSYIPFTVGIVLLFIGSTYIALDLAFNISGFFKSSNPSQLHSAWLFTLTIVWPLFASLIYIAINSIVVWRVLRESKPLILFAATAFTFALAEGSRYALSHTICTGTDAKIDGSFLATLLETATACLLYLAWESITEDSWDDYTLNSSGYLVS